jgi:hypothetical protein
MMEPENLNKTPSYDFALVAANGDIWNSQRGLYNHGQELLAE